MPVRDESSLGGLLVLVIAFIFILTFVYISRALNASDLQSITASGLQSFTTSDLHSFTASELHSFTASDLHSFIDSEYPWIPIGVHKGSVLYERTYSSGKKAWRYVSESGEYVYPHKKELTA